jgi:hypothetical protein
MKSEFKDFIGIFENVVPEECCNKFIDYFKGWQSVNGTRTRQDSDGHPRHSKDDEQFFLGDNYHDKLIVSQSSIHIFGEYHEIFGRCFYNYTNFYSRLTEINLHVYYGKIQKTIPGGGYHIWHAEREDLQTSSRALAFMLYLNDVEEGGETEFLYQKMRVKPTKGTILIWPADWTHTHRGNPPLSGDKYIYTGWMEHTPR